MTKTYTPMIQQYLRIKSEVRDAFLFFRLGDFYELFFDDAKRAAQLLEITLTGRDGGDGERIPMCGVPHHSALTYIDRLIEKGEKVAICEQVEDPKQAKGVVKREVVRYITPGTNMDRSSIQNEENHYIASVAFLNEGIGFSYSDVTTGELKATELQTAEDVLNELSQAKAKELLVASADLSHPTIQQAKKQFGLTLSVEDNVETETVSHSKLPVQSAVGRLLHYIKRTQRQSFAHMQQLQYYEVQHTLRLDREAVRNLELVETLRNKKKQGSLFWLLDETKTAMGSRKLKSWLLRPLISKEAIRARQEMVASLKEALFTREDLREAFTSVYDIERLVGRVAYGNVNAREFVQLRSSLEKVPLIASLLEDIGGVAKAYVTQLDACEDIVELISKTLVDDPPVSVKEGDVIRDGFHEGLDKYRFASRNGKTWIAELEQSERKLTGIRSLKVGYNKVFGYYLEVTKANLHLLPDGRYERRQTLTNAERFVTPALKEKEALILEAQEKSEELEYSLFLNLREQVKVHTVRLQQLANALSEIDVLQSFATIADKYQFTQPEFSASRSMQITDGRHPVVEKVLGVETFVPNDCRMDEEREMLLITGPNMAGKSTFMRQIALTVILAQMGSFVPASRCELPVFDQIFTRIGAADDLASGQSTFMVEMMEANTALQRATNNSLILFDEIGRGTSTYDGMALAQAMLEYIHEQIGAKTLFSTHYHELTKLSAELSRCANIHVKVVEEDGSVVFLHKLEEGAADRSYGIHVAELAALPVGVISRAKIVLSHLEKDQTTKQMDTYNILKQAEVNQAVHEVASTSSDEQLSLFGEKNEQPSRKRKTTSSQERVLQKLSSYAILEMTPMDAMQALYELQKQMKS